MSPSGSRASKRKNCEDLSRPYACLQKEINNVKKFRSDLGPTELNTSFVRRPKSKSRSGGDRRVPVVKITQSAANEKYPNEEKPIKKYNLRKKENAAGQNNRETNNSSNVRCVCCHRFMTYLSETKCCSICLVQLAKQEKYASPQKGIKSGSDVSSKPKSVNLAARHRSLNSAFTKSKDLKTERDLKKPSLIEVPNENGMGKHFHPNTSASSRENVLMQNRRRVRTRLGLGYRQKSDEVSYQYSLSKSSECVEIELNAKILSSTKQSRSGSTDKSILSCEDGRDVTSNKITSPPIKVPKKHKKLKTKSSSFSLSSDNMSKHISDDQKSNYLNVKEKEQLPQTVNNIDANNIIPVPKNLKVIESDSCETKVAMGQDNSFQKQHVFSDNPSYGANEMTYPMIQVDFQNDCESPSVPENVSDVMNEKLTGESCKSNKMYKLHKRVKSNSSLSTSNNVSESTLFVSIPSHGDVTLNKECALNNISKKPKKFKTNSSAISHNSDSTLQHISDDLKSIPKCNNSIVTVKEQLPERINRIEDDSNKNVKVFTKELKQHIFSSNLTKDVGKITNSTILVDLPNDSQALEVSQALENVLENVNEKITIEVSMRGNNLEYMPINKSANSKKDLQKQKGKLKRSKRRSRTQKSGEVSVPNSESTSSKHVEKKHNTNCLIFSKQTERSSTEKSIPSHTGASCVSYKFSNLPETFETKSSTPNNDSKSTTLYASDDLKSVQKCNYSSLKEKELSQKTLNDTEGDQVLCRSKNVKVIESDLSISEVSMGQIKPLVLYHKDCNLSNDDKTSCLLPVVDLPYNSGELNSPEPAAASSEIISKQFKKTSNSSKSYRLFKEYKSSLKTSDTGIKTLPITHKVTDNLKSLPEFKVFESTLNSIDAISMSLKIVLATPELVNDSSKDKVLSVSDCKQMSHEQQSCSTHERKILSQKSTPILTRTSVRSAFTNQNRIRSSTSDNNAAFTIARISGKDCVDLNSNQEKQSSDIFDTGKTNVLPSKKCLPDHEITVNVSNYSRNVSKDGNLSAVEKTPLSSGLEMGTFCEDESRISLKNCDISEIEDSVCSNSVQKRQSNRMVGNKEQDVLPETTFPLNNTLESMQSLVKCDGKDNKKVTLLHLMNCLPDNDSIIVEKSMFKNTLRFRCIKCSKLFGQLQMFCVHYGNCKMNLCKRKTVSINDVIWVCTLCHSNFDAVADLLDHKNVCSIVRSVGIPVAPTSADLNTNTNLLTNSNKGALPGTSTDCSAMYTKSKRPIKNSILTKAKNVNDELNVNSDIRTLISSDTSSSIKSERPVTYLSSSSEPTDGVIESLDSSKLSICRCLLCKISFCCNYISFVTHLWEHENQQVNSAPDPNVIDMSPDGFCQISSVCSLGEMPDTTESKVPTADQSNTFVFDPMLYPIAGNSAGTVLEGPVFIYEDKVEPKKEEKVDLKMGCPLSESAVNQTDIKHESKFVCPKMEICPRVNLQSSWEASLTSILPFSFHLFNPNVLSTLNMVSKYIPKSCKACKNIFKFTARNLDMKLRTTIKDNKMNFHFIIYCTKCDLKHKANFDLPLETLEGNFRYQLSQYLLKRQDAKKDLVTNCGDMNSASKFERDFFSSLISGSYISSPQSTSTNQPLVSKACDIIHADLPPTIQSDVFTDSTSSDTVYEQSSAKDSPSASLNDLSIPFDVEFTENFFKHADVYLNTSKDEIVHICSECFKSLKKDDIASHYFKYHDTSGIKSTINVFKIQ